MKSSKGKTPTTAGTTRARKGAAVPSRKQGEKDPVEVFCRVRPLKEDEAESCVEVVKTSILQMYPPECSLAYKSGHRNVTQHTFKHVMDGSASQKALFDRVGLPLVDQLLQGKNGLLFAYGITNSGKTYTVTGEADQPGILPRCLDVLFNSIAEVQAAKYVFRPDSANGFNVCTEGEARDEQTRNRGKKVSPRVRAENDFGELLRVPESRKITDPIDEDSQYSVFISYCEIYNNYVFDLLDDTPIDPICPKAPKSKILREDMSHNMFVAGATETEVRSTEEAYDVLMRGQKRRRVAQTTMNTESSRSHSVFTVRLVQGPLDHSGEEVIQDKSLVTTSQLSLVDLAGSERTARTHCKGERLREANNINANLMVLRTCMETLRDNQSNGSVRIVPYRDSKLTHLFKNYFDGEGRVCMVVCVSPAAEDYDETIHVMRFAEVTQEVMIHRPESVRKQVGLAPGRHRANMLYKAALKEGASIHSFGGSESSRPNTPHPYLLALGVLSVQKYLSTECPSSSLVEFREALENRSKVRLQLTEDLKKKQRVFREQLVAMETDLASSQAMCDELSGQRKCAEKSARECARLRSIISSQEEKVARLQAEVERSHLVTVSREHEVAGLLAQLEQVSKERELLLKTTEMYELDKRELQDELSHERHKSQQTEEEKDTIQKTMHGFVSQEKEKFERLARQMKHQKKDLQVKSAAIQQVKALIRNSPHIVRTPLKEGQIITERAVTPAAKKNGPPIKGKGRKRSASENWLEHVPASTVENGGIMQPQLKKKRTVSTPKPKHFLSKVDKYCLQHQEEDSEGDIRTAIFKGNVAQTRGGGTAVTFTDVETHRQQLVPPTSKGKGVRRSTRLASCKVVQSRPSTAMDIPKSECTLSLSSSVSSSFLSPGTSMEESWTDVETRCAVAVEGRPGSTYPALTHQVLAAKK